MSRDVGVGQLVEELEQRGDRLPFEIGAFVALEACEGLLQESVKLVADDVRVTLEGSVVVSEAAERAEPDEAARSLVSVLGRLLVAAGPGVPPYLLQLVNESAAGQNPRDLRHLHDAIEASLIPINRGASRRVLARLVRESDRPQALAGLAAPEIPQVSSQELDAELDELLGDPASRSLEVTPASAAPEEDEGPVTERIRMPRAEAAGAAPAAHTGTDTATDTATDEAPVSFRPPVPDLDLQSETVRVPSSEPALKSASVPVPDLKPPPAVRPAAVAAALPEQPPQPGPEPITATIRKWPRKEDAAHPPRGFAPPLETEAVSVTVSVTEAVTEAASVTEAVSVSEAVSEAGMGSGRGSVPSAEVVEATETEIPLETATEAVFGTGSVGHAESVPSPQPLSASMPAPAPAYDRHSLPEQLPKRRGGLGVLLFAAALGVGAYALLASGSLDALLRPVAPVAVPAPSGVIDVAVTPADAQIFVFVGRGPAVASGLPVHAAHEFIIFDRGLRPSRAVVDEGATWTTTADGSLYELAVQATPAATPADALDFGGPRTTSASAEAGDLGTIRIITNPQGAKVYRFVGSGPAVQISAGSIHEGQEVLVYHPEHETRRAVIGPSDWQAGEGAGAHTASLQVELPALAASAAESPEN
jgi:hypothetical protein